MTKAVEVGELPLQTTWRVTEIARPTKLPRAETAFL